MFLKSVFTAVTILIALPVAAQNATPAEEQFARSIDVEPGVYSMSTMILIEQAQRDDNQTLVEQLKQNTQAAELEAGSQTVNSEPDIYEDSGITGN